ncbi:MAG: hypothetical protein WC222_08745 [Parachlamydiales bacterium]|jgi:hypothetical protein
MTTNSCVSLSPSSQLDLSYEEIKPSPVLSNNTEISLPESLEEARQQAIKRGILDSNGRLNESFKKGDLSGIDYKVILDNVRNRLTTPLHGKVTLAQTIIHQRDTAQKRGNAVVGLNYIGSNAMKDLGIENILSVLGETISQIITPAVIERYLIAAMDTDTQAELMHCDEKELALESQSLALFFGALTSETLTVDRKELTDAFRKIEIGYSEKWDEKYSNTLRFSAHDHSTGGFVNIGHFLYSLFYIVIDPLTVDEGDCKNLKIKLVCPDENFREVFLHFLLGIMACDKPEMMNYLVSMVYLSGLIKDKVSYDPQLFSKLLEPTLRMYFNFDSHTIDAKKLVLALRNIIFGHHKEDLPALLVSAQLFRNLSLDIIDHWKKYLTEEFYKGFWQNLLTDEEKSQLKSIPHPDKYVQSISFVEAWLNVQAHSTSVIDEELIQAVIHLSTRALELGDKKQATDIWERLTSLPCFNPTHAQYNDSITLLTSPHIVNDIFNAGLLNITGFNPFEVLISRFPELQTDIRQIRLKHILSTPLEFYDYDWQALCKDEQTWNNIIKVTRFDELRQGYLLDCLRLSLSKNMYSVSVKIVEILTQSNIKPSKRTLFASLIHLLCENILARIQKEDATPAVLFAHLIEILSDSPYTTHSKLEALLSPYIFTAIDSINPSIPSSSYLQALYPVLIQGLLFCIKHSPPKTAKEKLQSSGCFLKLFQFLHKTLPPSYSKAIDLFEAVSEIGIFHENLLAWNLEKRKLLEALPLSIHKKCPRSTLALMKNALSINVEIGPLLTKECILKNISEENLRELISPPNSLKVLGTDIWLLLALKWFNLHDSVHVVAAEKISLLLFQLLSTHPEKINVLRNPEVILKIVQSLSLFKERIPQTNISLGHVVHFLLFLSPHNPKHLAAITSLIQFISTQSLPKYSPSDFALLKNLMLRAQDYPSLDFSPLYYQFVNKDFSKLIEQTGVQDISALLPVFGTLWNKKKKEEAAQWIDAVIQRCQTLDYKPSKKDIYVLMNVAGCLLNAKKTHIVYPLFEYLKKYAQGKQKSTYERIFQYAVSLALLESDLGPFLAFTSADDSAYNTHPHLYMEGVRKAIHSLDPSTTLPLIRNCAPQLENSDWVALWDVLNKKGDAQLIEDAFAIWKEIHPIPPKMDSLNRYQQLSYCQLFQALLQSNMVRQNCISEYFNSDLETFAHILSLLNANGKKISFGLSLYLKLKSEKFFQAPKGTIEPLIKWLFNLHTDAPTFLTSLYLLLNQSLKCSRKDCAAIIIKYFCDHYKTVIEPTRNIYQRYFLEKFATLTAVNDNPVFDNDFFSLLKTIYNSDDFPIELSLGPYKWLTATCRRQIDVSTRLQYDLRAFTIFFKANKTAFASQYFSDYALTYNLLMRLTYVPELFTKLLDSFEISCGNNLLKDPDYSTLYGTCMATYLESIIHAANDTKKRTHAFELFLKKHVMYCNDTLIAERAVSAAISLMFCQLQNDENIAYFMTNCERILKMLYSPMDYRKIETGLIRSLAKRAKMETVSHDDFVQFDESKPVLDYYYDSRLEMTFRLVEQSKIKYPNKFKQRIIFYCLHGMLKGLVKLIKLRNFNMDHQNAAETLSSFIECFDAFFYYNTQATPLIREEHANLSRSLISSLIGTSFFERFKVKFYAYALFLGFADTLFPAISLPEKLEAHEDIWAKTTSEYPECFERCCEAFRKEYKWARTQESPEGSNLALQLFMEKAAALVSGLDTAQDASLFIQFHSQVLFQGNTLFGSDLPLQYNKFLVEIFTQYIQHFTPFIVIFNTSLDFQEVYSKLSFLVIKFANSTLCKSLDPEESILLFKNLTKCISIFYKNISLISHQLTNSPTPRVHIEILHLTIEKALSSEYNHLPINIRQEEVIRLMSIFLNQKMLDEFALAVQRAFNPKSDLFKKPSELYPCFDSSYLPLITSCYSKAYEDNMAVTLFTLHIATLLPPADAESMDLEKDLYSESVFFLHLLKVNLSRSCDKDIRAIIFRILIIFINAKRYDDAAVLCTFVFSEGILNADDGEAATISIELCDKGLNEDAPSKSILKLFKLCCRDNIFTITNAEHVLFKGFKFLLSSIEFENRNIGKYGAVDLQASAHFEETSKDNDALEPKADSRGQLSINTPETGDTLELLFRSYLSSNWDNNRFNKILWACNLIEQFTPGIQSQLFREGFHKAHQHKNIAFMNLLLHIVVEKDVALFSVLLPAFLQCLIENPSIPNHSNIVQELLIEFSHGSKFVNPVLKSLILSRPILDDINVLYHHLPENERIPLLGWIQVSRIHSESLVVSRYSSENSSHDFIVEVLTKLRKILKENSACEIEDAENYYTSIAKLLNKIYKLCKDTNSAIFFILWFLENGSASIYIHCSSELQQFILSSIDKYFFLPTVQNLLDYLENIFNPALCYDQGNATPVFEAIQHIIITLRKQNNYTDAADWMHFFIHTQSFRKWKYWSFQHTILLEEWVNFLCTHHLFTYGVKILQEVQLQNEQQETSSITLVSTLWKKIYQHAPLQFCLQTALNFASTFIPPKDQLTGLCQKLNYSNIDDLYLLFKLIEKFSIIDEGIWKAVNTSISRSKDEKIVRRALETLAYIESSSEEFRTNPSLRSSSWAAIFGAIVNNSMQVACTIFQKKESVESLLHSFQDEITMGKFAWMLYKYHLSQAKMVSTLDALLKMRLFVRYSVEVRPYDWKLLDIALNGNFMGVFNPLIAIFTTHLFSPQLEPKYCLGLCKLIKSFQKEVSLKGHVTVETINLVGSLCNNLIARYPQAHNTLELAQHIIQIKRPELISSAFQLLKANVTPQISHYPERVRLFKGILLKVIKLSHLKSEEISQFLSQPAVKEIITDGYIYLKIELARKQLLEILDSDEVSYNSFETNFQNVSKQLLSEEKNDALFRSVEMLVECTVMLFTQSLDKEIPEKLLKIIEQSFVLDNAQSKKATHEVCESEGSKIFKITSSRMKVRSHMIRTLLSSIKSFQDKREPILNWTYETTALLLRDFPCDGNFNAFMLMEVLCCSNPQDESEYALHVVNFQTMLKNKNFASFWHSQKTASFMWNIYNNIPCPSSLIVNKHEKLIWVNNIVESIAQSPTWWSVQHFSVVFSYLEKTTTNIASDEYRGILSSFLVALSRLDITTKEQFEFVHNLYEVSTKHIGPHQSSFEIQERFCYILMKAGSSPDVLENSVLLEQLVFQITCYLYDSKFLSLWELNIEHYFQFITESINPLAYLLQHGIPENTAMDFINKFAQAITASQFIKNIDEGVVAKRTKILRVFVQKLSQLGFKGQAYALGLAKNPLYKTCLEDDQ